MQSFGVSRVLEQIAMSDESDQDYNDLHTLAYSGSPHWQAPAWTESARN
jgi:hypothetical protein